MNWRLLVVMPLVWRNPIWGFAWGDQITLEGVLEGMMVASGNDAAVVVAENVSGSVENFAKDMNRVAAKAGAKK